MLRNATSRRLGGSLLTSFQRVVPLCPSRVRIAIRYTDQMGFCSHIIVLVRPAYSDRRPSLARV